MLSAPDIKRQILLSSDKTGIKKKLLEQALRPEGKGDGEVIEMGHALEAITKMKGWIVIEEFMLRKMNIVGLLYGKNNDEDKGLARGYVELMQYIDQVIKAKDELLRRNDDVGKRVSGMPQSGT